MESSRSGRRPQTDDELIVANRGQSEAETDPFTERRYEQFLGWLDPGTSRVLDVGCGTGRGGAVLRSALPEIELHGVELLPDRSGRIPAGVYDEIHSVMIQDLEHEGVFDAIVAGEVIEHVPYRALSDFVEALLSLLRPGGRLLITTPNPHYVLLKWRNRGTVLGGPHVSAHCPVATAQYLRYVGFDEIAVRGSGKVSRWLGTRMPFPCYGSYLVTARSPLQDGSH